MSVLKNAHDLRLVLFGGEEQGLFGSLRYVASLTPAERARLSAVVNRDMIGTLNTQRRSLLVEGAPVSRTVGVCSYASKRHRESWVALNSEFD